MHMSPASLRMRIFFFFKSLKKLEVKNKCQVNISLKLLGIPNGIGDLLSETMSTKLPPSQKSSRQRKPF